MGRSEPTGSLITTARSSHATRAASKRTLDIAAIVHQGGYSATVAKERSSVNVADTKSQNGGHRFMRRAGCFIGESTSEE